MASQAGIDHAIQKAAKLYRIDPAILRRQLGVESNFQQNAVSKAGARGLAQFIPETAAKYGVNLNDGRVTDDIMGAAHYDRDNLDANNGDWRAALSTYNSGKPDAYKDPSFANGETADYVKKILNGSSPTATAASAPGAPAAMTLQHGTTDITESDPELVKKQFFAQWLAKKNPNNPLIRLGALDPNMATTKTVSIPTTTGYTVTGGAASSRVQKQGPQIPTPKGGVAHFNGKPVAAWIAPILEYAKSKGWKGSVNSGYRSDEEQVRIWNSGVRPAAKPKSLGGGGSNHSGTVYPLGAIDVSEAAQLSRILKNSPYASKLQWAGAKDPVHFSKPHNGSY